MGYLSLGTPAFRRAIFALFSGAFVTFAVLYSVQPLLPILARQFHVGPATASLSLSFSTALMGLAMLGVAPLSRQWGPKRTMSISLVCTAAIAMVTAGAPNFWVLLLLRAALGVALAGLPAVAMGYVNDEFEPSGLGQAMGMYVSGTSIGGMSGRIIVGTLTSLFGWRVALVAIGALSLLLTIWFWRALPPSRHARRTTAAFSHWLPSLLANVRDKRLWGLFILPFLLMGGFVAVYNYFGFLLMGAPYHLSQAVVGWIFIVYVFGTFSSAWMGRRADQVGRPRMLVIAIVLMLAGLALTLPPPIVLKILGLALFTFGFFGAHAVASSWVGQRAVTTASEASSLYLFFYYAGSSVFGAAGGLLWSHGGWSSLVSMVGLMLILALLAAVLMRPKGTPRPSQSH